MSFMLAILAIGGFGCSSSGSNDAAPPPTAAQTNADSAGWVHSYESAPDGSVVLSSVSLSDQARQAQEFSLSQAKLEPISLNPIYNVSLFQIQGVESFKDQAFFLPQAMISGDAWSKGALTATSQPDGSIRLSFPVLTLNPSVFHELQVVERELRRLKLKATTPEAVPGCPASLFLDVQGEEYDFTPTEWTKHSKNCPAFGEFEAKLRLAAKDAEELQKKLAADPKPHLRLVWELRLSYPVRKYKLSFQPDRIWEKLLASDLLQWRQKVGEKSVAPLLWHVLENSVAQSGIKVPLAWKGKLEPLLKTLAQIFFELSDVADLRSCAPIGPMEKCAILNESWKSLIQSREEFQIEWEELETVPTSDRRDSWSPAKGF
jgi:hypothetical protein